MTTHVHCGLEIDAEECATTPEMPCYQTIRACEELGMPTPYEGRDPRVTEAMERAERSKDG